MSEQIEAGDALSILRRIEPALREMSAAVRDVRHELLELRTKDLVEIKIAIAKKPDRSELWGGMALTVALFALAVACATLLMKWTNP
jgi:hypothetical protein